jgi:hypothetical protein
VIDSWVGVPDDIQPATIAKYQTEFHILPAFQGRELGSLTFEEIEERVKAAPPGSTRANRRQFLTSAHRCDDA